MHQRRSRWLPAVAVALGLFVAAAVILANLTAIAAWLPGPVSQPGNTWMASPTADIATARTMLDRLAVVPRPAPAGDYRRAAFGDAWQDTDGNGCNQRDDVLFRDVVRSAPFTAGRQRDCTHDMLAGTWVDPYTGQVITLTDAKQPDQAQSVQIDHIVALSVAWRYGAATWSDARRLQYANDLRNLAAVGGRANRAKGGSDAAEWRPPRQAQCGYAVRYVLVKAAYALPVDTTEREALRGQLGTCP